MTGKNFLYFFVLAGNYLLVNLQLFCRGSFSERSLEEPSRETDKAPSLVL